MVEGLTVTKRDITGKCEDCLLGKFKANPFTLCTSRAQCVLEKIHYELAGPVEVSSLGGAKYALIIVDDYSPFTFASFVNSKDLVPNAINHILHHAENETGLKATIFQSDNGTEVVSKEMEVILDISATIHQTMVPHTPQMNGVAECEIQSAFNAVHSMLHNSQSPKYLWAEALAYYVHCHNQHPCASIPKGKTPYELYYGKRSSVAHLHAWGCPCYYRIPLVKQQKLSPHGLKGFFVGVFKDKAYHVFDPSPCQIVKSRDVVFVEGPQNCTVTTNILASTSSKNNESADDSNDTSEEPKKNSDNINYSLQHKTTPQPHWSSQKVKPSKCLLESASVATTSAPNNYKQAIALSEAIHWQNAMLYEHDKIVEHQVTLEVDCPQNCQVISGRWVYNKKQLNDGDIEY